MKRLLFILPLLAACHPIYERVQIDLYSSPPEPVYITGSSIELPVGIAVAVEVTPFSGNNQEYFDDDKVLLTSDDRQILRVDTTENNRRFVLTGVQAGKTCVWVEVMGEREECIPAEVSPGPK